MIDLGNPDARPLTGLHIVDLIENCERASTLSGANMLLCALFTIERTLAWVQDNGGVLPAEAAELKQFMEAAL